MEDQTGARRRQAPGPRRPHGPSATRLAVVGRVATAALGLWLVLLLLGGLGLQPLGGLPVARELGAPDAAPPALPKRVQKAVDRGATLTPAARKVRPVRVPSPARPLSVADFVPSGCTSSQGMFCGTIENGSFKPAASLIDCGWWLCAVTQVGGAKSRPGALDSAMPCVWWSCPPDAPATTKRSPSAAAASTDCTRVARAAPWGSGTRAPSCSPRFPVREFVCRQGRDAAPGEA
jgi:hypothetical protein